MDSYYTPREVAGMLKISYDKVLELLHSERLRSVKIGKQFRVTEKMLDEFVSPEKEEVKPRMKLTKKTKFTIQER